jgi:hypothetical protein
VRSLCCLSCSNHGPQLSHTDANTTSTNSAPLPTAGGCKPFKLYPGVMIIVTCANPPPSPCMHGERCSCTSYGTISTSLEACLTECKHAGYDNCKSVTFDPAGKMCGVYSERLEDMGAHATAQVIVPGGLGVVSASYCTPPPERAKYPISSSTLHGTGLLLVCMHVLAVCGFGALPARMCVLS